MKIIKHINIWKDIEIDLSSEDILEIIENDIASLPNILHGINEFAAFLKGISDAKIAEISPEQRKVVEDFLLTEAERYNKALHSEQAIQCPTCKCFDVHSPICSAGYGKILPPVG